MRPSQETYHAENTESNETERDETEKLSIAQRNKNQVRHSWRLRGLDRWAILRREGKSTRVLLQKLDKVLDSWH